MNVSQFSAVNFIYFFPQFVLGLPLVISVFQQNYSGLVAVRQSYHSP